VAVKDVMERLVPELNDEFVRTMGGVQTLEELRGLIRSRWRSKRARLTMARFGNRS